MTLLSLYQRLKEKGYVGTVATDNYAASGSGVDLALLKERLELDRREVFTIWYDGMPNWGREFDAAHRAYAAGTIDTCIDFILLHR